MRTRTKLTVSLTVFFLACVAVAAFVRTQFVAPIIMYHSVSPQAQPENRLAVRPETFARQMRFLKTHHYNVVPLEAVAAMIKEKKTLPPKTIAITFDDGYKDNFTYAYPVLKEFNLPATVFIIVHEVERPQNDRLSWKEIEQMCDSGLIDIGSHAIGPEPLVNIKSDSEVRRQIFDSRKILEEKLARKVTLFSYPEGLFNEKIRQLVIDAGYGAAVATKARGFSGGDVFALKRIRISENAGNEFVFAFELSGYYPFLKGYKNQKHGKK